jgi:hypothetical protein
VLAGAIALALAVAEGKLAYYSYAKRDLHQTAQGLMLAERRSLAGKRVFQDRWTRADRFVLEHMVGAEAHEAAGVDGFLDSAAPGDYVIVPHPDGDAPELVEVRANRQHRLCRRREGRTAIRGPQSAVRSPQSAVRGPQSAVRSPQSAVSRSA